MTITNATLNMIYSEYLAQRQLTVVPTTWQKDVRAYEEFIKDSDLAKMPIKEIAIERGFPCEENDYVFMRKYRGKICICTERCIDSRLRKYCGKTNMVAKSAHDIRRTTITTLSNEGMRINDIQKWAGHQNASMTQSYIKSQAGTDNKNYLNALNPLQIAE